MVVGVGGSTLGTGDAAPLRDKEDCRRRRSTRIFGGGAGVLGVLRRARGVDGGESVPTPGRRNEARLGGLLSEPESSAKIYFVSPDDTFVSSLRRRRGSPLEEFPLVSRRCSRSSRNLFSSLASSKSSWLSYRSSATTSTRRP